MSLSLYKKLVAVFTALLGFIGILFVWVSLSVTRQHIREIDQKLHRGLPVNLLKEKILMTPAGIDEQTLREIFHTLMVVNPRIEVYLLDQEGRIISFSAPPGVVETEKVSLEPVNRLLEGIDPLPILGDDPRHPGHQKVFTAAPVMVGDAIQGYLYIVLAGEKYESVAGMLGESYVLRLGLGVFLGIILFGMLAGLVLFHQLTRRLRKLTATVESFRASRLTDPHEDPGENSAARGDELDRLALSFDSMAEQIDRQVKELQATDSLRRELVANVSHDLRTPLASLQGYLETLLLKGDLQEQTRRHYLEVARRQSERLGKLVGDLFDLGKLESNHVQLQLENCSLAELVQDVVQKYRLESESRGVGLNSELRQDLPFVSVDLGLIERVLDNLLDNAFRYTPDGGTVTVDLSASQGNVILKVVDTGSGIPPEDLPHVFDRYYRARRSGENRGAGLGLAIAKRIVELHGGTIKAQSRLDEGSTILIMLPLSS